MTKRFQNQIARPLAMPLIATFLMMLLPGSAGFASTENMPAKDQFIADNQHQSLSEPPVSQLEIDAELSVGRPFTFVWRDKNKKAIDVFGVIDVAAPRAIVWDVMIDCMQAMEIVRSLKKCMVLETAEDGSWDVRRHISKGSPLTPKVESIFRSDYDPLRSIRISRAGGDMEKQNAVWTLATLEDGITRVTYRAASNPQYSVPNFLLKRAMRKDMPIILKNLKAASEKNLLE